MSYQHSPVNIDQLSDAAAHIIIEQLLAERHRASINEIFAAYAATNEAFLIELENTFKEYLLYYWKNLISLIKKYPELASANLVNSDDTRALGQRIYQKIFVVKTREIAFETQDDREQFQLIIDSAMSQLEYLLVYKMTEEPTLRVANHIKPTREHRH